MKLFGHAWTPEAADTWTRHDLVAAILSPLVFFLSAAGSAWAVFGDVRGWFLLAGALGASLIIWAVIDGKLKAQSIAYKRREELHKDTVEERQRWGD